MNGVANTGVGIFVFDKFGRVLIGKRLKRGFGYGYFSLPGGKVDWHKTVESEARKEVREETGLEIGPLRQHGYADEIDPNYPDVHFVSLYWYADALEPDKCRNMEPDKCAGWHWCYPDHLKKFTPLWVPLEKFLYSEAGYVIRQHGYNIQLLNSKF